jgi:hypothetical protein
MPMTTIIAGRFEQQAEAQEAIAQLTGAGFAEEQISSFYVNPPGQHDRYPIGGDHDKSPGAEQSPAGTAAGAATGGTVGAAVGAATAPVTGPLGAVTGALVGAHIGSLVGSLGMMKEDGGAANENPVPVRQAGMLVAVGVPESADEARAIEVLRSLGAADIERTAGTMAQGDWLDFDPIAPPSLIEMPSMQR